MSEYAFSPGIPSGYEINYTQITSAVNVVSLTEASGTTIISPGAIWFDGAPVMCEFFANITTPSGTTCSVTVCLFEGATQIGRLVEPFISSSSGNNQMIAPSSGQIRFTPTIGLHTYTVTAFTNTTTGTPQIAAGAGGTGTLPPAFIRFIKV